MEGLSPPDLYNDGMDTTPTINAMTAVADQMTVQASTLEQEAARLRSGASLLYREVSRLRHPHTTSALDPS